MTTLKQIVISGICFSIANIAGAGTNIVNYWVIPNNTVLSGWEQTGTADPEYSEGGGWSGTLWGGKSVYMQGDKTMSRFDAHEKVGTTLYYTGTFNGNMQEGPDVSYFFTNPIIWLVDNMTEGSYNDTYYGNYKVNAKTREQLSTPIYKTARVEFTQKWTAGTYWHDELQTYIHSDYGDVYMITYWPDVTNNGSREEYWCIEGGGQVRAVLHGDNRIGWWDPEATAPGTIPSYSQAKPANPWYSLYKAPVSFQGGNWNSYVYNGAFENTANHLTGWVTSSNDCIATDGGSNPGLNVWGYNETGVWKLVLRGSLSGGDSNPDGITSWYTIPVIPGATYTLSGHIFRDSSSDAAYLDFDDGAGYNSSGGSQTFTDQHAASTITGQWQAVSTDITFPSNVYGVKVRCVRDGANQSDAYFDDIRLTLKL